MPLIGHLQFYRHHAAAYDRHQKETQVSNNAFDWKPYLANVSILFLFALIVGGLGVFINALVGFLGLIASLLLMACFNWRPKPRKN